MTEDWLWQGGGRMQAVVVLGGQRIEGVLLFSFDIEQIVHAIVVFTVVLLVWGENENHRD
jgi:hypothetical protein